MVELREARKASARIGLGLQYVLKEARIFDVWSFGVYFTYEIILILNVKFF